MRIICERFSTLFAILIVLYAGFARAALAVEPLVEIDWVKNNLNKTGVVVVDIQPEADYLRSHIPGAVNTSFFKSGWREDRADKVPEMLPENFDNLVDHIGNLGIDNNTHVVLVSPGKHYYDVGWATRIYWTLKFLGHEKVSILNGGMDGWSKGSSNPVQDGSVKMEARIFIPHLNRDIVATVDEVKKASQEKVILVDSRPEDQYAGINRHPRARESGTMPGAINLPTGWITVNNGGQFRSREQLEQLYKVANVPTTGKQINFCNTGQLASIGWFVSSELVGNKNARLYAGSMVEWTLTKAGLVEQKVKLQ